MREKFVPTDEEKRTMSTIRKDSEHRDLKLKIDFQRKQITALKIEHEAVLAQKRSRAEVAEAVERQFVHLAEKGHASILRSLQIFAAGGAPSLTALAGVASAAGHPAAQTEGADGLRRGAAGPASLAAEVRVDIGPLLVAAVGVERMREMYLGALDAVPEGLSRNERQRRLDELSAQLESAEILEEQLIEQSEELGMPIARRPDASPHIVLALKDASSI